MSGKVWLVYDNDFESASVVGVYDNEAAADAHAKHHGDYWVSDEEVLSEFVPPPAPIPESQRQCQAVSLYTTYGPANASIAQYSIQCRLMRGHDGPHECLPSTSERTP